MAVSANFSAMLEEALAPLGRIAIRRMFSGGGVYCDGVMFGLVASDALYLKADDITKPAFEAEGCKPFVVKSRSKPVATSYWLIPERLYDDSDELVEWARKALAIAHRVHESRPPKAAKTPAARNKAPHRKR